MIFLDTSYLLALIQPRDSLHQRARAWAQTVREPVLVSEYVLCETINALSVPVDRPKAHALIKELKAANDCEIVAAAPALWEAGLRWHADRSDKEWSLTDCLSFVIMVERAVTQALSYDRHFEQAGFEALLRRDPT